MTSSWSCSGMGFTLLRNRIPNIGISAKNGIFVSVVFSECLTVCEGFFNSELLDLELADALKNFPENYRCDVCDASRDSVIRVIL